MQGLCTSSTCRNVETVTRERCSVAVGLVYVLFCFSPSAIEGEEAHGCQTWGAAELDTDAGFHPQWHCRSLPERSVSMGEKAEAVLLS